MSAPGTMTVGQKITYALPHLALNFSGMFMGQRLLSYYNPSADDVAKGAEPLVAAGVLAMLFIFGGLVDAFADPPIGYLSDRSRSRFGRRMPFVVLGTPLMVAGFLAHWFPPDATATTLNAVYIAGVLFIYKIAFTAVLGPYEALMPEIAADNETRVSLSVYISVAFILGNALGAAAGAMEAAFADGATVAGVHLDNGVEVVGVISGLTLLAFLLPVLNIRETPRGPEKDVEKGFVRAILSVYTSKAFLAFLGMATLAQTALVMLIANLDYFCKEVLQRAPGVAGVVEYGEADAWRSYLLGALFAGALVCMPIVDRVAPHVSKKKMMITSGWIICGAMMLFPVAGMMEEPAWASLAAMLLLSYPTAVTFVLARVFIAEVADYDEVLSGKRREGVLNGAMALVVKTGLGVGLALVSAVKSLGDSREDPLGILLVGPVAAALILAGLLIFRMFPEEEMHAAIAAFRARRGRIPLE